MYHGSAADNKGITRSGAGRKGWPRVMIRGWQERSRSAAYSARKSSVNALFRRGGFTVGTAESMCVHRFSRLNNSTIRYRVPRQRVPVFEHPFSMQSNKLMSLYDTFAACVSLRGSFNCRKKEEKFLNLKEKKIKSYYNYSRSLFVF